MHRPCKTDNPVQLGTLAPIITMDFQGDTEFCGRRCAAQVSKWMDWVKNSPCLDGTELKDGYLYIHNPLALVPTTDYGYYHNVLITNPRRRIINRAHRLGYDFRPFEWNDFLDDIFEINTSRPERGGQPMSAGYLEKPKAQMKFLPGDYCPRHPIVYYGAFMGKKLRAYCVMHFLNNHAAPATLIGHGDYFRDGIMNGLIDFMVRDISENHPWVETTNFLTLVSGREGLRDFKRNAGFQSHFVRVRNV